MLVSKLVGKSYNIEVSLHKPSWKKLKGRLLITSCGRSDIKRSNRWFFNQQLEPTALDLASLKAVTKFVSHLQTSILAEGACAVLHYLSPHTSQPSAFTELFWEALNEYRQSWGDWFESKNTPGTENMVLNELRVKPEVSCNHTGQHSCLPELMLWF